MKRLYCIYDKVANIYNPPFLAENDSTAKRSFNNALANSPFRADMSLYMLGTYNDDTDGSIDSCKPAFVCNYEEAVNNA